jgi:competence protein ComEA
MLDLSRSQLLVYGALGVAALLLGARWIRSAHAGDTAPGQIAYQGSTGGGYSGTGAQDGSGSSLGHDLIVDVAGEVRQPGVYHLPDGSRVTDAIERGGGATGAAFLDAINLAAELADGQQVVVPAQGPGGSAAAATGADAAADGPISLGSATVEQLDTIEGIGPVTAQNILAYRDEHGGVSSVEDLDQISGIGPATMEALRARLQP